ncbi:SET domain-containing protein [Catalinimonas niigatensis]|uniref:SET domain-containing protein n=1 Tax=Catalinimonas niigatensis TaxID=1397264 RepID=UPI0026661B20|nr:SET domain-containing protein [Catalinimonas niigatensis]WPP50480.1 SET domain-containing protein [Catalinimonas niigatensis]
MIHPDVELRHISEEIGYGIFAKKFIPKGTITYVQDSLEIEVPPTEVKNYSKAMQEVIEKYSFIDERGYRIISWDVAKYVNHCCQCNTISTGYGFEIAITDIYPGEQITDEYGIFNMEQAMPLFCDKEGCRKHVRPQDFDHYYPVWDKKILTALHLLREVPQPLMHLLEGEDKEALEAYFDDPKHYKSVYSMKYKHV